MKGITLKVSLLTAALGFSAFAQAQDFDLSDMLPARPGESVPAGAVIEGDIVVATDDTTAVQAAHQSLLETNEDGIRLIQVASGIGILSTGGAHYQTYDNMNATLLSKRGAYNQAYLVAKKQLVENMNGIEVQCGNMARVTMDVIDTGTESVANTQNAMIENCLESVEGSLAGYVTFDVYDNVDSKHVRVSLISTPKTRAQISLNRGAVTQTTDPNDIFRQVVTDINRGVLPPMGAKVLTNETTGEVILLGYGSAIIRENSNARVASRLKDTANRQSQTRARAALLGTLQGEEVYWQGGFDERQIESAQQFEYEDPYLADPETVNLLSQDKEMFLNHLTTADDYGTIARGELPAGVSMRSFTSEDGHWQYSVAVYSPTLEAVATQAAEQTQQGIEGRGNRRISVFGGVNDNAANPQGASGRVSDEHNL